MLYMLWRQCLQHRFLLGSPALKGWAGFKICPGVPNTRAGL